MKNTLRTLSRLLEPIKRHKMTATILILGAVWRALVPNVLTVVIQKSIDALTVLDERSFVTYCIFMGGFFVVWFLIQYPTRNARRIGIDKMIQDMYDKMLTYFTKMDNNAVEGYGTGKVNNIIQRGLDGQRSIIENILGAWVKVFLQFLISAGLTVYYLGWIAGIILTAVLIIILFISAKSNKWLSKARRMRREQTTFIDSSIVRHIMSKFEILQNNKAKLEVSKRGVYRKERQKHYRIESKRMILVWEGQKLVMDALRMIAFIYAGYSVIQGDMTLGFFSAVWMLTNSINQGLFDITETLMQYNQSIIYVERLWDFIDKEKNIRGYEDGDSFVFRNGDITIDDITYNYGKGSVLENFSLHIAGATKLALVGISGSGKSTIVKLIAGYIHPQKGNIIIDGQSLPNEDNKKYVSLKSYYQHIGYLTQEPNVFDGSIYENLTYALDYEPSKEQIDQAIQGAQCQFIYEFPEGVQTEIGEKGVKLSGGQRQRLAIAKVMLKNPDIIILDEPTSALDSFSEEDVTKAFNNLFEGKTVIIIAHRLQTVKKADRIIVLDHGKVVEEGNHDSLVKSGGVYAKMLELQSGF